MPSIKYSVPGILEEEIICESTIVSQFLCDAFPSHLLPATREDPTAPLRRARINFFLDTWNTKIASHQWTVITASDSEKQQKCEEWRDAIKKEIEPLLADAAPFFGGSKGLTFAEVIVAPFLIRWYAFANDGEMLPRSFVKTLDSLPNFGKWAKAVCERKSVLGTWEEKSTVEGTKAKVKKMLAAAK